MVGGADKKERKVALMSSTVVCCYLCSNPGAILLCFGGDNSFSK